MPMPALPRLIVPEPVVRLRERVRESRYWPDVRESRYWPDVRDIALPVVAMRFVLMGFVWLALAVFVPSNQDSGLLGIWNRWDGPHLLEIAQLGYGPPADPARIVLFPLFPVTIRVVGLIMPLLGAAMLISLVATVAAAIGLQRLVQLDGPEPLARWSIVAMLVFPTAYAFIAPYTEALFLALTVWAFVAVRRDNMAAAGILGTLAALTRIQGLFLLPALGLEYLMVRRRIDRDALWIAMVGAGFAFYLAINQATFGNPFHFVDVQLKTFQVQNQMPWLTLQQLWSGTTAGAPSESWVTIYLAPLASLVLLAVVTVWALVSKHSRPSYALYSAISLVAFATLSWPISVPRYLLGVFPIFIALGSLYRSPVGQAIAMGSIMLMGMFATLFVMGHWAF
jgi:Gpi18-like mannosyltransferase